MSADLRRALEDAGLGFAALRHLIDRVAEADGLSAPALDLINLYLDDAEAALRFNAGRTGDDGGMMPADAPEEDLP